MRVPFALQVLSKPTAAGIRTYNHLVKFTNQNQQHAESTALFIEKFSKLFDCLNSKNIFHNNMYCRGLRENNIVKTYLIQMREYLSQLVVLSGTNVYCIEGYIQTLNGILMFSEKVFAENQNITFILTSRFSQDPLENLFSVVRGRG